MLHSSGKKPEFRDIVGIHNISRIFLDKTSNHELYIGLLDSTPTTKAHDARRLDRYGTGQLNKTLLQESIK